MSCSLSGSNERESSGRPRLAKSKEDVCGRRLYRASSLYIKLRLNPSSAAAASTSLWVMDPHAINGRMSFSRLLAASQSFSEALCQSGCFCIKMGDHEHAHAVSY